MTTHSARLISTFVWSLFCTGASTAGEVTHFAYTEPAMGSMFRIEVYAEDKDAVERAVSAAFKRIEDINALASDYLPESELSRLNREPANKPIPVSADLFSLIAQSLQAARQTDGAFDITVTYAVQQWRRAKRQKQLPTPEQTARAIAMTDWKALHLDDKARTVTKLKEGILIDLGGIGKGYAADAALAVMKQHGMTQALVAGSGDLAIGDPPPGKEGWDVELRSFEGPEGSDALFHVILSRCGCSTSGDLHQFLELGGNRYSHIVNPRTGLGLTDRIACTVIAPDATTSDVLATAMCVLGPEKGSIAAEKLAPPVQVRFTTMQGDSMKATTSKGFPPAR
jgi:thiamine biosynthesis lipoprotein